MPLSLQAFTPGMRQLLDLAAIWRKGSTAARRYLDDMDLQVSLPPDCPFVIDDLLVEDFDIDEALATPAAARTHLSAS